MKLREVRKSGIEYCEENNCDYTYISFDNVKEFYLTEKEDKHTVFLVKRNGGLNAYRGTNYAAEFHKEFKKRRKNKRRDDKRKLAEMLNDEEVEMDIDMEDEKT